MTPLDRTERAGALAWLAGRLHWERLLADLHEQAERPVSPAEDEHAAPVATTGDRPARAA